MPVQDIGAFLNTVPKFDTVNPGSTADWNQLNRWLTQLALYLQAVLPSTGNQAMNNSFSFNFDFTSLGTPDTRPTTWGNAISADSPLNFVVPAGQKVQLMRVAGSCSAMFCTPSGTIAAAPPGTSAGFLVGLITQAAFTGGQWVANTQASPFVDAASEAQTGCPMFLLADISAENPRETIQFDLDLSKNNNAFLDASNTLLVREAFFLNNSGLNVHMEVSGTIEFQFVPV